VDACQDGGVKPSTHPDVHCVEPEGDIGFDGVGIPAVVYHSGQQLKVTVHSACLVGGPGRVCVGLDVNVDTVEARHGECRGEPVVDDPLLVGGVQPPRITAESVDVDADGVSGGDGGRYPVQLRRVGHVRWYRQE